MNLTTKKFLSALLTAAVVFTQAGAAVSADSSPWGKPASQAQSEAAVSVSKDFGNSKYWAEKDKYGYAYPYSYYQYAPDPVAKKAYIEVYEALHDRKPYIYVTDSDRRTYNKNNISIPTIIHLLCAECPELYFAKYNNSKNEYDGDKINVIYYLKYLPDKTIETYEKTFAKIRKDFDAYLKKNNATTTKKFLYCALAFVGSHTSYDYESYNSGKYSENCINIVGAFIEGKAICTGYVQAFNYLCRNYGITYAFKSTEGEDDGHALSSVIYKNIWYNFDPTAYKWSNRQMTTDAQVKEYGFTVDTNGTLSNIRCKSPVSNGKAVKPPTKINKPKAAPEPEKPTSDTAEETFIEYHYTDFDTFSFIVKGNLSYLRNRGYTYYKITPPEGKIDITLKYLKQMKKDGTITYTALSKTKTYVKITL